MPMFQVCSSFPIASDEALAGFGCGRICRVLQLCGAKGPVRGEGGAGATYVVTAVLGMQSSSSVASQS